MKAKTFMMTWLTIYLFSGGLMLDTFWIRIFTLSFDVVIFGFIMFHLIYTLLLLFSLVPILADGGFKK